MEAAAAKAYNLVNQNYLTEPPRTPRTLGFWHFYSFPLWEPQHSHVPLRQPQLRGDRSSFVGDLALRTSSLHVAVDSQA